MKRYIIAMLTITVVIGLFSCKKDNNTVIPDPQNPDLEQNYSFISSGSSLTLGINTTEQSLVMQSNIQLDDITLTPPIEIDPIKKDGLKKIITIGALSGGLKVSGIHFWEQYAFVSYMNPAENAYGGSVDVYSIKQVPNITRIARFSFSKTDIHSVSYVLGRMVLACSQEGKPAFVEVIVYNPNVQSQLAPVLEQMEDVSASNIGDVIASGQNVYALVNQNTSSAGVYIFNNIASMGQNQFISLANSLSMTSVSGSNDVMVLQNTSPVSVTKVTPSGQTSKISLGISGQPHNMGVVVKNEIYAHAGNKMQIFNNDGSIKQPTFSWTATTGGAALSINQKNMSIMKDWLMIMGNDGAGVHVCGLRNRSDIDVTEIFDVQNIGQSLSLLATNDNLAFIADQNGAMQVLWRVSLGMPEVPIYYEQELETIRPILQVKFPETTDKRILYPDLFVKNKPETPLNIKILNKTKIYVSIAFQGASNASSIGYYCIDGGNFPDVASKLNKIAMFPNTKAVSSVGNTIPLCDKNGNVVEFEPGQEIGFYFIPGGWDASANNGYGGINTNIAHMHTHLQYNQNQSQQHVLFRLQNQYPLFMGFEDQWISVDNSKSDADLNDIIIAISDNMDNAAITNISNISNIPVVN